MAFNKTPWFNVIAQDSSKILVAPQGSVEGIIDCNGLHKYLNLSIKVVSVFGSSNNGNISVYVYCFDADNASESDTIPIYCQEIKRVPNTEQIVTIPDLHVSAIDSIKVKIINDSLNESVSIWSSSKALYSSNLVTSFDEKTKISMTDVQSDFLFNKIVGEENKVDLTILNQGNNETLNIDVKNDISQWNADKIKNVIIDDSNIDDKTVLVYDKTADKLKYVNILDLALSIDTTSFGKELSSIEDTVQDAFDKLDDHVHEADETGATTTEFNHRLSATDDTVQKALDTLDNYVEIASETTVVTTGFTKELTSAENTVQKALDKLDDHVHEVIYDFAADQLDTPVSSDWAINALAPISAGSINSGILVRRFDDTKEEGVGLLFRVPYGFSNIIISLTSRPQTAPTNNVSVIPRIYVREIIDNSTVEVWNAGINLSAINFSTSVNYIYSTHNTTYSELGLVAGRIAQIELTRNTSSVSDTLVGESCSSLNM